MKHVTLNRFIENIIFFFKIVDCMLLKICFTNCYTSDHDDSNLKVVKKRDGLAGSGRADSSRKSYLSDEMFFF